MVRRSVQCDRFQRMTRDLRESSLQKHWGVKLKSHKELPSAWKDQNGHLTAEVPTNASRDHHQRY